MHVKCILNTVELQYLELRYLNDNGYVEMICKSQPFNFKVIYPQYLEVFKQSRLVRDSEG